MSSRSAILAMGALNEVSFGLEVFSHNLQLLIGLFRQKFDVDQSKDSMDSKKTGAHALDSPALTFSQRNRHATLGV